jgi:MinD-like ATPase involved in chromosome partitioning or flagellar assembly
VYVITFYSFKGGVGRTLALVNVAAELARIGRKVLLVDFDLEAPGLETFERLRPPQAHPGLVEFVNEYLSSKRSPDVRDYVYSAGTVGKKGGQLWVMPAGRRDATYQAALVSINWKRLYKDCQGYWFFEDTKAQWEAAFQPDYVLIDSRTGHTDVEGICTRQLPDAVAVLFFPNEQNLVGLKDVCARIRREKTTGLKKDIRLHFVMSNVPDLDDEDRPLRRRLEAFHKELGVGTPQVIHRYESVLLFNQAVFVLDRPRSRLAREYRKLSKVLVAENDADRDSALAFLHSYARPYLREAARGYAGEESYLDLDRIWSDSRITKIADLFWDDPDVLAKVAECRTLEGSFGAALRLLDRAIAINAGFAPALLQRALCKNRLGDVPGATADLVRYLQLPGLRPLDVLRALRELLAVSPSTLREAIKLSSVQDLDLRSKIRVAQILASGQEGLEQAIEYLSSLVSDQNLNESELANSLCSYFIQARRWHEAVALIERVDNATSSFDLYLQLSLDDLIASWGLAGTPPEDLCRWWLEHAENEGNSPYTEPLLNQVNALAAWRLGDIPRAQQEIEAAIAWMRRHGRDSFSWWRYAEAPPPEFLEDCEQIRRLIQGEAVRPAFLGEPATSPS